MNSSDPKPTACEHSKVVITSDDLPLSCPQHDMPVWNAHPRVYLPIEDAGGSVHCPYCGALYILKDK